VDDDITHEDRRHTPLAHVTSDAIHAYGDFEMFQMQYTLPIGGLLQGLKKAERDASVKGCALYVIFVTIFLVVVGTLRPVGDAFLAQDAIYRNLASGPIDTQLVNFRKEFMKIDDYDDLWTWVRRVLARQAFQCCYYSGDPTYKVYGDANDLALAKYNRLITPIRFRQVRSRRDDCNFFSSLEHELKEPCWPSYSGPAKEKSNIWTWNALMPSSGSSFKTELSMYQGDWNDGGVYGDEGHVVDVELDAGKALEKIKGMIRERWTDEWTRGVAIDVNTYNPNYDIATVFRFKVDVLVGGRLVPHIEAYSCRLLPYASAWDKFRLALEIIFCFLSRSTLARKSWTSIARASSLTSAVCGTS
jgi:hypothetical protein